MDLPVSKKETEHLVSVLRQSITALEKGDEYALHQLSDQTIHSASITQHTEFILIAVMIYSLNKLISRKDRINQKTWNSFVRKYSEEIKKSITQLEAEDITEFTRHLEHAKSLLISISPIIKQDVEQVLKKASVNKATKIYEHGISLNRTAQLLGLTQWELLDYVGQRNSNENPLNKTIDVKVRAKMALEFFR